MTDDLVETEWAMRYLGFVHKPDAQGRSWNVVFPDLPGCVAAAGDFENVIDKAREALSYHLEGMLADGETPPSARSLEAIEADPAVRDEILGAFPTPVAARDAPSERVRVNITIDKTLLARVDRRAGASGVTRSRLIEGAVMEALED